MDDESGESMKPVGDVTLIALGESELESLVHGWWKEAGNWFQSEEKHTKRNDLLLVEMT